MPPVQQFRAAAKILSKHGIEALKPQFKVVTEEFAVKGAAATAARAGAATASSQQDDLPVRKFWVRPVISARKAAGLRKQAIRDGTYGSFDAETGEGWDPTWDVELAKVKATRSRGQGRYRQIGGPKLTSRQRSREKRAVAIEKKMEGMQERMEEYLEEKVASRQVVGIEAIYKKMMSTKKR